MADDQFQDLLDYFSAEDLTLTYISAILT